MIELDEVGSTNSFLRDYRPVVPVGVTLVTAEYQTAGRGQASNHWESERGKNLLFSLLLQHVNLPMSHVFLLSEAIAIAIREAVAGVLKRERAEGCGEAAVTVKWPNDIYVGDCKIAGILIENELRGSGIERSIIGCGVNVNQEEFLFPRHTTERPTPDPSRQGGEGAGAMQPTPISLRQVLGYDTERLFLLEDILEVFMRRYGELQRGDYDGVQREYHRMLYRSAGMHEYADERGVFSACIEGVEPSGHLILRDDRGKLRRYAFKEVRGVRL